MQTVTYFSGAWKPCCILLLWLITGATGAVTSGRYQIEINKSTRELNVLSGSNVIRSFHISIGRAEHGAKRARGDNRTPVGTYHVVDFNNDSKFYFFMLLNYPNTLDAWHGYRNELISAGEFREIVMAIKAGKTPPQNTALGGFVGIHGLGEETGETLEIHATFNWTEGCIALTNEEITELRKYVSTGTTVVIHE